jgi:hypothetical protein
MRNALALAAGLVAMGLAGLASASDALYGEIQQMDAALTE